MMEPAIREVEQSEALLVVGPSLQVYPAASLLSYLPPLQPILYLDPYPAPTYGRRGVEVFAENASAGIARVQQRLLQLFSLSPQA
jgi:NAD-dependent deacetylase